ncbi:hypothetical protein GCM10020367_55520 [Streptomyces sannanensis]|uniref:Uncharacterized protein n=1 Tax=Streptomyces sannanensis TaxID=285536 RepID=A0ABP6SK35_9ACTN
MSEYQYYEFLAVDRPLSEEELAQVRALSTRADITPTHFVNEYHWGDFRGDTTKLVEQLYDAHLYYANWGSRRLVLRLPGGLLPAKKAAAYAMEEVLSVRTCSGHTLLDFSLSSEDAEEWDFEASFSLSDFVGLRAELAAGDMRGLYVAWLAGLTVWELAEDDEEEYARELEPPVPAGMSALTGPQRALAGFLRVGSDLLAVAAEASAPATAAAVDGRALAAWIAALPAAEKDALLVEAALGTGPQPGPLLLARYRAATLPGPRPGADRRSAAQLLDGACRHRTERQQREKKARAATERARALEITRARDAHLTCLAKNTEQAWRDVDRLIAQKKPGPYDVAVTLLKDLREVHTRADTIAEFHERAAQLREAHRSKPSLMRRFDDAGFPYRS